MAHSHSHNEYHSSRDEKLQVAWSSLFVSILLVAAKLVVGLATGSLAILSQAAEAGFDSISVLVTLLAVRISAVPPDEEHPYGHGKFENLSALLESLFLLGLTVWIAFEAITHIIGSTPRHVEVTTWSFIVLIVSIVLDLWRGRKLHAAGKEHGSQALEGSALHFFADMSSTFVALIGLALVKYAGIAGADDWAALVLSVLVATLSVRLAKRAIDGLTDRSASAEEYQKIQEAIEESHGIEGIRKLRVRPAGPALIVDAGIEVNRVLPFAAIERVIDEVKDSIARVAPGSDVTIHWHPVRSENEAPFDTLKVIVAQYGILPHNIELAELSDGSVVLDYHLEFEPGITLGEAERRGHEITEAVKAELPNVRLIYSHLEEERSDRKLPLLKDVSDERAERIAEITRVVGEVAPEVRSITNIRLYQPSGESFVKLMLAILLPADVSLAHAHDVSTALEAELRKRYSDLSRIVIHTHPA